MKVVGKRLNVLIASYVDNRTYVKINLFVASRLHLSMERNMGELLDQLPTLNI